MSSPNPAGRSFEGRPLPHPDEEIFDQGLTFDVATILSRRRALRVMGAGAGLGALVLVGCGGSDSEPAAATAGQSGAATTAPTAAATSAATATAASPTSAATATTSDSDGAASASCDTIIPEETAGPYPGDGSNGPDVLTTSGVVRSDITTSFGDLSGTAEGIPCTIELSIADADNGCVPYAGAAVYAWHCDREGRYSLYSQGATDQNYLRGVQEADADGIVRFTSIFPACYSGRWPHVHFEVYPDLASATDVSNKIATSQIAIPKNICDEIYATAGYEASVGNLSRLTLSSDNVFGNDGGIYQLATVSGGASSGVGLALAVPVSATTTPVADGGPGSDGRPPGGPGGPPPSPGA